MNSRRQRFLLGTAALLAAAACPALAQILPDVAAPVDRILEDRVADQIERSVETSVEQLNEIGGKVQKSTEDALDATPEIVSESLGAAADIANLPGIVQVPEGRAIRLEQDGPWMVVANEWILLAGGDEAGELQRLGAVIIEDTPLSSGSDRLLIISLPADNSARLAIEARLDELGAESLDRNHVYNSSTGPEAAPSTGRPVLREGTTAAGRLGLIDTDIDETHPLLADSVFEESDFVDLGALRPQAHGTAVASILASALPKRTDSIRAASVFFLSEDGSTGATSASLVKAIDWMLAEGVEIINFSLSGPPNKSLEVMINRARERGVTIVAAVGNEGPASGPLYPAAYDGVLGVTAVDTKGQVYRWANQGAYVDVAINGVNVDVARPGGGTKRDSGTSLAAPQVAAWLAYRLPVGAGPDQALALVREAARPAAKGGGRDDITGWGILTVSPAS